jgi:superfamily II DNA/RNA helicase
LLAPRGRWISPADASKGAQIIASFADLGISKPVVAALSRRGITKPFPVQSLVVRDALAGRDLLVQSPTGSGKTLAFGIPLVERVESGNDTTAALVLAPTRELAGQIVEELRAVTDARGLRIAAVYGGVAFGPQSKAARHADILIATPGRLEDLIARGVVSLGDVEILVLDEADRMLDMGFKPAVDRITRQTPGSRQTLFFSATLEGAAGKLAAEYTRNPRRHVQAAEAAARVDIEHRFLHVDSQSAKLDHLVEQLRGAEGGSTLVFVRTKRGADRLASRLRKRRLEAVAMHGDKSQRQRERALARFEAGEVAALIATDVAARGIDVAGVTHVINFDAPADSDSYVHRVGRTGRAGRRGTGISFVLADQADEVRRMTAGLGIAHGLGERREGGEREHEAPPAHRASSRRRRRRRPKAGGNR